MSREGKSDREIAFGCLNDTSSAFWSSEGREEVYQNVVKALSSKSTQISTLQDAVSDHFNELQLRNKQFMELKAEVERLKEKYEPQVCRCERPKRFSGTWEKLICSICSLPLGTEKDYDTPNPLQDKIKELKECLGKCVDTLKMVLYSTGEESGYDDKIREALTTAQRLMGEGS